VENFRKLKALLDHLTVSAYNPDSPKGIGATPKDDAEGKS
jgi:hypothetical protein